MKTKEGEQNSSSVCEELLFIGGIKWGVFQLFEMLWMLVLYSLGTPMSHITGGDPGIWRSDLTGLLLDRIGNALYLPVSLPSESRWWKEARNKSPENYTAGVEELSCHRFSRQKRRYLCGQWTRAQPQIVSQTIWEFILIPDKRKHTDKQVRQWSFSSQNMHQRTSYVCA